MCSEVLILALRIVNLQRLPRKERIVRSCQAGDVWQPAVPTLMLSGVSIFNLPKDKKAGSQGD